MTDTSSAGTGAEPLRVARLRPGALVAGLVAVLGAMVIGMALGPVDISPKLIVYELLDDLPLIELDSGLSAQRVAIIEQIRLPRVVLGFLVGATLSVSGAAYQGAFPQPARRSVPARHRRRRRSRCHGGDHPGLG
jgi:iron complex transport system permease protein